MFGFNHLSEFTHHLETVFDLVRNNKLSVTNDIISMTFEAIDQIKHLLQVGDLTESSDINQQAAFIKRIEAVSNAGNSGLKPNVGEQVQSQIEANDGSKTFLISIKPNDDILRNGTNPFYLLDDLHAMGEAKVVAFTNKVADIKQFNPISSYCNWQVILNTTESVNEIKDVFIFVEDECEIDIQQLKVGNIIRSEELEVLINKAIASQAPITNDQIEALAGVKSSDESADKKDSKRKIQLKEHKISSIRVNSNKIDDLVNLVSELVTIQAQLNLYAEKDGGGSCEASG